MCDLLYFIYTILVITIWQIGLAGDDVVLAIGVMKDHRHVKNGFKQLKTPSIAKDKKLEFHIISEICIPLRRDRLVVVVVGVYLHLQLYMQVYAHSSVGMKEHWRCSMVPIQLIEVVVQDGTIAKTVIAASGAFISNHEATNYETTQGINHFGGGASTTFEEVQPILMPTVQMNGFQLFTDLGVEVVKLTFHITSEIELQFGNRYALHRSSSVHILEDKDNLKEWDLSGPSFELPSSVKGHLGYGY
ncbi:hypothetical protein MKW98_025777 [Papaver atlanticum]|uniref:Uncharacterized protein n=1 Tax=Papaver atlanticum TaxID=357466 RepID=A0AAD4SC43_9MAGN|nr:hypothetical protein MKW98_025777 [Papaver atlanticum]